MRQDMVRRGNWREVRRLAKVAEFNGIETANETATKTKIYGEWN